MRKRTSDSGPPPSGDELTDKDNIDETADPWSMYLKRVPPPAIMFRVTAPAFSPFGMPTGRRQLEEALRVGETTSPASIATDPRDMLIAARTDTVARLTGELEAWNSWYYNVKDGKGDDVLIEISKLDDKIKELKFRLPAIVEASCNKCLPDLLAARLPEVPATEVAVVSQVQAKQSTEHLETSLELELRIHSQVMAALEGTVSQLLRDAASNFQIARDGLDSKLKNKLRYTLQQIGKINAVIDESNGSVVDVDAHDAAAPGAPYHHLEWDAVITKSEGIC